jgi:penicillin-binding protein 1A
MRVETTPLDSIYRMQQILHASLVSIDPSNGHVRAWVGGNDYRYFQYDHVLSKRQAGSAFKPFLYATALSSGMDPCEYISNERKVYEEYDDWSPANVRNEYEGFFSMTGALANSVNTVSAHYISRVGPQAVAETARQAGIRSPLMAVPSLALGTANVSLLEITAAYSVFLNEGMAIEPIWLLKVEDKNGKVLYERKEESLASRALPSDVALMTRQMLQAVVDSGTARSLRYNFGLYGPLAGKTGTTQNSADTWFIGFSPGLITGVWTGVENPGFAQIYKTPIGSGSSAVPVWGDYYAQISRQTATQRFTSGSFSALPDSLLARLNCSMYIDQLPSESWWDSLFAPKDPEERSRRREENENKKGRIKRWLESIF